jgi:hypothetical protein
MFGDPEADDILRIYFCRVKIQNSGCVANCTVAFFAKLLLEMTCGRRGEQRSVREMEKIAGLAGLIRNLQ